MMAVIPILLVCYARKTKPAGSTDEGGTSTACAVNVLKLYPIFVPGLLALAIFRSIGDLFTARDSGRFPFWGNPEYWTTLYSGVKEVTTYLLSIAITAEGLSTQFSKLRKLTIKPFLIGLLDAVSVGLISFILVQVVRGPIGALIHG